MKSVRLDSGDGTADVVDGSSVLFTPDGNLPGQAELTYVVTDAGRSDRQCAGPHRDRRPRQNTPPTLQDDDTAVATPGSTSPSTSWPTTPTPRVTSSASPRSSSRPMARRARSNEGGHDLLRSPKPGFTAAPTRFIYEVKDGYGDGVAQVDRHHHRHRERAREPPAEPRTRPGDRHRRHDRAGRRPGQRLRSRRRRPATDRCRRPLATARGSPRRCCRRQQVSIVAAADARRPAWCRSPIRWPTPRHRPTGCSRPASRSSSPPTRTTTSLRSPSTTRPSCRPDDRQDHQPDRQRLRPRWRPADDHLARPEGPLRQRSAPCARSRSRRSSSPRPRAPTGRNDVHLRRERQPQGERHCGQVTVQVVPSSNSGPVARDDIVTVFGAGPGRRSTCSPTTAIPTGWPSPRRHAVVLGRQRRGEPRRVDHLHPAVGRPSDVHLQLHDQGPERPYRDRPGRGHRRRQGHDQECPGRRSTIRPRRVSGTRRAHRRAGQRRRPRRPGHRAASASPQPAPGTGSVSIVDRQVRYSPPPASPAWRRSPTRSRIADGNAVGRNRRGAGRPAGQGAADGQRRPHLDAHQQSHAPSMSLANDSDPDGPNTALDLSLVGDPAGGPIGASVVGNKLRVDLRRRALGTFIDHLHRHRRRRL